ncbi:hypothetical protein [Runella sp.]|jgi:hypothetical protein|uniref:hypothetical protein n=1 Tax=Runella sp. TaxID=1960881 RepID=UPI0026059BA9|nr:hypothetical protein [Runella sp.]
MKKELSYVDISRIHSYVEGMGVEFYDVQVEIVDHIASVIEEQMTIKPEELFDSTLSKFTGFDGLVNEKRRQVARQYDRYIIQSLKSFFSWPKVIFTLLLLWLIYSFLDKADNQLIETAKDTSFIIGLISTLGYSAFVFMRNNQEMNKLSTSNHIAWYFIFIQTPQILNTFTKYVIMYREQYTLLFAITYCVSFLLIWAVIESYEKLRLYGREKYLKALA